MVFEDDETKEVTFFPENKKTVRIGRSKGNEIVLDSSNFSRVHTSFIYSSSDKSWYLMDGDGTKESTNGTWLFLDCQTEIYDKMLLRLGRSLFEIRKFAY